VVHSTKRLQRSSKIARQWSLLVVSAIAVSLGSYASVTSATSAGSPQTQANSSSKTLKVVTTFIPITGFTTAVAGDRADMTQLLSTNVWPHDFQAKPDDAERLAKADALVENGLGLESFLDDLVKNVGNANLKIIDSSKGVQTISTAAFEGQAQDQSKEAELNPHIWLDPKRAVHQVENIRDGLIAADPAGSEIYTTNAAAYIVKLQQLDGEFTQRLRPFASKTFVTYHDIAPYFAQSYQLKAQFLVGIPEENASLADVERVIDAAKGSKLKTLLMEPQAVGNPFSALAKDLNVQIGNFDPMETASTAGIQPDYYFTVMRQNLANLETAFGSQPTQSFLPNQSQSQSRFFASVPQPASLRF
jgi:zinc transport system substrate-binding protein